MRIHVLQHVPYEGPGIIEAWAGLNQCPMTTTRFYEEGQELPGLKEIDLLIVMGGPMSATEDDAFPWMAREKAFIKKAIAKGKKVLGICLGAQLIADVLGARVRRNQHEEIGWAPIWLTEAGQEAELLGHMQSELPVLHWHGETFDIPAGAKHMVESAGCRNQAFLYGDRVGGLEFLVEFTRGCVQALIQHTEVKKSGPFVQAPAQMLAREENAFRRANHGLRGLLLRMANID
jgi:GMP synthase-like glutamine amidotransferase